MITFDIDQPSTIHLAAEKVECLASPLPDAPGQPCLNGADVFCQVVPVQAQTGLQAEAVAGTQACRVDRHKGSVVNVSGPTKQLHGPLKAALELMSV